MGRGREYECPKCGYTFQRIWGVGMLFPSTYAETVEKAKAGALGEELCSFFAEHDDGAIDAQYESFVCEECGALSNKMDLTMYVRKSVSGPRPKSGRWCVAFPQEGIQYVDRDDLNKYFLEYAKYPHKCKKCSGPMIKIKPGTSLLCPECKCLLEEGSDVFWD